MNTPSFPPNPPDVPTAAQQASDATQTPPWAATRPPTATPPRPPGQRRRLAWLAAILYVPIILLVYALYLYGPMECVAGPFCALGEAPGIVQVLLLALGFSALYFVGVRSLAALLDEREPERSAVTRVVRQAARFETIRPLLAIFGGVLTLSLLVGLIARTLNLSAFVIGAGIAALLFSLALVEAP